MSIVLYQLPTGNDASVYLASASADLSSSWDASAVPYTQPTDTPLIGDESVWFVNVYDTAYEATAYVRTGHYVARIIWQQNLPKAIKPDAKEIPTAQEQLLPGIEFTAQAQIQCIEDGGCSGITKLGKDLLPTLT